MNIINDMNNGVELSAVLVAASPLLRAPQQFFQQFWFLLLARAAALEEAVSRSKPEELKVCKVRSRQAAKAGSTGTCAWTSKDWTAEKRLAYNFTVCDKNGKG